MSNIVRLFEKVQKIHYRICPYDKNEINENLSFGDCRHKSELLKQLLERKGFEVKKVRIIFDWADLPIPKDILKILKSGTKFVHRSLKVKVKGNWINVDCTWNPELKKKGFPITEKWDGRLDTRQISYGKIEIYDEEDFDKIKIKINEEEASKFAEKLNEFLGW
jgi:hypothetical protein